MGKSKRRIPSYRLHKPTGQAVVTLNGRDYYLGKHDTPESHQRYHTLIAEWIAADHQMRPKQSQDSPTISVTRLVECYWAFAQGYYADPEGRATAQQERVRRSIEFLTEMYPALAVDEFGPLKLKAIRQKMIERGWVRRHINQCVACVKRCFKWGVSEELVPSSVTEGLRAVEGLKKNRSPAPESKRVLPADERTIEWVRKVATAPLRGLLDFQLHTGARPGEAIAICPKDVDQSGRCILPTGQVVQLDGIWVYIPVNHKTSYRDHSRVIMIGPQAQELLRPFMDRAPETPCFSPQEALAERAAANDEELALRRRDGVRIGCSYRVDTYRQAVDYAIRKANGQIKAENTDKPEADHEPLVERFSPHQLRHNAATRLVAQFGWDITRILLGHRHVDVTRIYAEDDLQKAARAIRDAG